MSRRCVIAGGRSIGFASRIKPRCLPTSRRGGRDHGSPVRFMHERRRFKFVSFPFKHRPPEQLLRPLCRHYGSGVAKGRDALARPFSRGGAVPSVER
jgi:hypothetical protein